MITSAALSGGTACPAAAAATSATVTAVFIDIQRLPRGTGGNGLETEGLGPGDSDLPIC